MNEILFPKLSSRSFVPTPAAQFVKDNSYNVIQSSDWHVGLYSTYNPTPFFRLNQFDLLTDKIIETAKEFNVKELWVLGDLLVTPKSSSEVLHKLKQCFNRIVDAGILIRFVYGNHDLKIKRLESGLDKYEMSSLLSVLADNKKVFAYTSEVVEIAGKSVYFCSWRPKNHVPYQKANYLCCHGDVSSKISPFVNDLISTDGYDRVISGHIHVPVDDDNFISPSTPIPHSFGDYKQTSLVIFDVVNNKHTRKYIYEDFLSFHYVKTIEEKAQLQKLAKDHGKHVYIKVRPDLVRDELDNFHEMEKFDVNSLDINPKSALLPFIEKLKLPESRSTILNVLEEAKEFEADLNTPNLKFDILKLRAKNFLSIYDLDMDFTQYSGLTSITGPVGAGKSTLFQLIRFLLEGKLKGYDKSDYSRINKEKLEAEIEIAYEDHIYKIYRSLGSTKFYAKPIDANRDFIDADLVDSNTKGDLQKDSIEARLKFIKFMNILYITQSSKGIFASMSESSRVSFLGRLIGLSLITKWTSLLKAKIDGYESDISKIERLITDLNIKSKSINEFLDSNKEYTQFLDKDEILNSIKVIEDKINLNNDKLVQLSNIKLLKSQLKNSRNSYEIELIATKSRLSDYEIKISSKLDSIRSTKSKIVDESDLNEKLVTLSEKIKGIENLIDSKTSEKYSINSEIGKLNNELNHINSHPDKCPTCNQEWKLMDDETRSKTLNDLESNIKLKSADFESTDSMIKLLKSKLIGLKNEESSINKIKSDNSNYSFEVEINSKSLSEYYSDKSRLEGKAESLKTNIDELKVQESSHPDNIGSEVDAINIIINDFKSNLSSLNQDLGKVEVNNNQFKKVLQYRHELDSLHSTILKETESMKKIKLISTELDKFNSKVFTDKGLLVATLLNKVSDSLNHDELLKVETIYTQGNGVPKPTLNLKLYVSEYDKHIDYDFLSGGQRLQADLRFMSGLTNSLGSISLMMMDETFKFFDEDTIMKSAEILKTMNTKNIFLIIHGVSPESFSNHILDVTLTDNGSKYEKIY